ncbi:alpha-glucosidase [Pontibacillus halophilus JSM 076056 = DSM 19796]|uniref:Alpha-glucosidase n=1 Tax=Pontibacillus halophilus JSM 076056 = DSM 19796 TaxID=1385510 RepID=A0A0A5GD93_9BACI|nr:glycoside hydrolase family 31 protein [Pontibacillus halophilus]KGX89969.1 alpha-glucosidase [Pontibacillus halophilus JSM 076056 = DSM 19796]
MIKLLDFKLHTEENNCLTFTSGDEEVSLYVLEEDVFRVFIPFDKNHSMQHTWIIAPGEEDIPASGRNRFDTTPFTLPAYEVYECENTVTVETNRLRAVVHLSGFSIDWYGNVSGQWVKIAGDRKTQAYNFKRMLGERVLHYMERSPDERYYGLGEKGGPMNRYGKRYQMRTIDAMGYDAETTDPLYKHIPFYMTYSESSGLAYGMVYDNYSDSIFDMGAEYDYYHKHFRYYQAEKGDCDYYFMLGPKVKDVVERYTWLTGQMILPPKWSLGYSGSTMTYTDAPDAQEQLKKFVDYCKDYDIPCDSFQLSSGYTSIKDKRYVFNWNTSKVPEPKKMTGYFHDHGIKVCANVKPCLLDDHPMYEQLEKDRLFVHNERFNEPETSQFWDALGSYLDFTNDATIAWWKEQIKAQLLEYGIDSIWNDNNEYEIWDEAAMAHGFGSTIPMSYVKPIQTLLMMKASYEAQKEHAPNDRPYLISRSGMPGMQRYVQTWSGDNYTDWKTIRYNLKMGLSLSLSGVYNFGHDVGGFAGKAPEPELFVRWIQNGIFHPRFTIHSWNEDASVNVPWMYPEYADSIRELMKERVKWTPYFYHLMYRAHKHYEPLLTPTFYYFQDDGRTFEENDEFMVGEDLLIANVMEKGQSVRDVYLPANANGWYDMNGGNFYEGGQTVSVSAELTEIPMFAVGGSAFPIRDGEISFTNKEDNSRGVIVYPHQGKGNRQFRFYEDDGESMEYTKGNYAFLSVELETTLDSVTVKVNWEGSYQPPFSEVTVYVLESESRDVHVPDGQKLESNVYVVRSLQGEVTS